MESTHVTALEDRSIWQVLTLGLCMCLAPTESTHDLEDSVVMLKQVIADTRPYVAMVHDVLNTTATVDGEGQSLADLKDALKTIKTQPVELRVRAAGCIVEGW
jgi:hypothetical protein